MSLPNPSNTITKLLQQAMIAIQSGEVGTGRKVLTDVLRTDPRNEQAWLWMAGIVENDEQRRTCFERVLALNPRNEQARKGLDRLAIPVNPGSCPQCGGPLAQDDVACLYCKSQQQKRPSGEGTPEKAQALSCPACTMINPPGASRCHYCQQALKPFEGAVPQSTLNSPVRPDRLREAPLALGQASITIVFGSFFALIALVMMIIFSALLGNLILTAREQSRLAASSVETTGTVVELREVSGDESEDTYYVRYTFRILVRGDDRTFSDESQVTRSAYNQLEQGAEVKVQYLPSDPTVSQLPQAIQHSMGWFITQFFCANSFLLIFVLAGGALIWQGLRTTHEWRLWRRNGVTVEAEVLDLWQQEGRDSDGDPTTEYYIAYRLDACWSDGTNEPIAQRERVSQRNYRRLGGRTTVPVRYLPTNMNQVGIDYQRL